jgi:acyl-CoA thioester hydrolase
MYSYSRTVLENEIDHLNHVNNIWYVQWVQQAAEKHWNQLIGDLNMDTYVWIVLRHEIDYLTSAQLNDTIRINTWIEGSYGVKSVRVVEMYRDHELLVRAKTTWCLLDRTTSKPKRIPDEILEIFA